jgi:phage terminase large subunit GpA-like protein
MNVIKPAGISENMSKADLRSWWISTMNEVKNLSTTPDEVKKAIDEWNAIDTKEKLRTFVLNTLSNGKYEESKSA